MRLQGKLTIASDKSISHRGVILGSIANGITKISNFLTGEDCIATIDCMRRLGIKIETNNSEVLIHGGKLREFNGILDTKNSGTTTRLMSGLLSGYPFKSIINGDESLQKRPMKRVIEPLTQMGAKITALNDSFCPMEIIGGGLNGITYELPVASAQLKSAIILAGINADGKTEIIEKEKSRDHTENMLKAMGASLSVSDNKITVFKSDNLDSLELYVPGDISSAAFFIVAALITKHSELLIENVGVNPTRTGIIDVLLDMGGDIALTNKRLVCGEPVADILVKSSDLKATKVAGEIIPTLIDEIPILAVAAAFAEGKTVFSDVSELRVKETDRITAIINMLSVAGVKTDEETDSFCVYGTDVIKGGIFNSFKDHRMAMSAKILSLMAMGESQFIDFDCVAVSYPNFIETLESVLK